MADLLWPGDHRAGDHLSDAAAVRAALRVESAWLATLVDARVAPEEAAVDVARAIGTVDLEALAAASEASGNPVIPLLGIVRERLSTRHPESARWVHRGLTSQDVLDSALVLSLRDTVDAVLVEVDEQVRVLSDLADLHRGDAMVGRTLTQHAVPITFGLKAAQWLHGILDTRDDLRHERERLPIQVGGAAGTLAAPAELLRLSGSTADASALAHDLADRLGLRYSPPWHTSRAPVTRAADALVRATGAWGRIAADVLLLARPEIAELAEPTVDGRGGSSTMPQKANPVLSVLVRRAALAAPALAAQLHVAAASYVDERPDGAWHMEWSALAQLGRRSLTAASQTTELLAGLHVDTGRMARLVQAAGSGLLAEQRSLAGLYDDPVTPHFDPTHYLGSTDAIIDELVARARQGGHP